ncbi:MAG: short-chain fatty acyl-CoA regulator family protein [Rhodobacteraceae bacterium]|nr:short-chain fatty acyl-CoA regulator family protein [Paracoccaceae bacterium]
MRKSLSGTRIREQRRQARLTQKSLAEQAGISPSYLNLIEHNRRAVAGKVLLSIARVLDVPVSSLADGVDSAKISDLYEAAAHHPTIGAEVAGVEELAGRFPGWAQMIAALYRQTRDQEAMITALSDRLTHDPFLAESLHGMLSNITAIRSTSNILTNIDDIEPEKQARFHTIIHEESRRLTDSAQSLVQYFDKKADPKTGIATPQEELDAFLEHHNYGFPQLDNLGEAPASNVEIAYIVNRIMAEGVSVENQETSRLITAFLQQYARDAQAMPQSDFTKAARRCQYNPSQLAHIFGTSLHAVFRRLAFQDPAQTAAPPMGLAISNAAGRALSRRPIADFAFPRHGNACPLWPLYQSFATPHVPTLTLLELPGQHKFIGLAIAEAQSSPRFGAPPELNAAMLILHHEQRALLAKWLPDLGEARPIGITCRICPRQSCTARTEPQILGEDIPVQTISGQ